MNALSFDIAIVGAGPVGAAMALGLAQQGFAVQLIERAPVLPPPLDDYDLRVYALAPAVVRLLERLGVWASMQARRVSPYRQMQVWEREPGGALSFDAVDGGADTLGHIVENHLLQAMLWQALPDGVLRTGAGVRQATRGDGNWTLSLDDGATLSARVLVIAEGRDSALRGALGIEMLSGAYAQSAVVCHVVTEKPHRQTAYQRFLPTGPLALLPLADGRSSIVWSSSQAEPLLALDDEDFCRVLGEASQHVLGAITGTTRRVRFPLGVQHAERYVDDGLALIGDAAHLVHPLAGQGVNLGLADVESLLQVLVAAREQGRDIAQLRVLKRYERARRADVLDMIAVTDGLYRAFRAPLPGFSALRDWGLGAVNVAMPLKRELVRRAVGLSE